MHLSTEPTLPLAVIRLSIQKDKMFLLFPGFTTTLYDIIRREKPTHIAVVFDAPGPTDRAAEHSFYKANRQEMPEDIRNALPHIKNIIDAFNIPRYELAGFEADDLIGTLAKNAEKDGYITYMVTPDKDYAQLVSEKIFMYKPQYRASGFDILGVEEVKEKWEVDDPLQVIDILGLWGDSVDNIPGIPGIGEKTAKKLIKLYGSVEGIIEHSDELKGKQKENVINFADQGLVSKKLATIIVDAPVTVDEEDLVMSEPDREKLAAIFAELEFRTLGKRILGDDFNVVTSAGSQGDLFASPSPDGTKKAAKGTTIDSTKHKYHLVNTAKGIKDLVAKLKKQKQVCFDTETTGLDANNCELVGLAFAFKKGEAYYVPCPEDQKETEKIVAQFKPILESKKIIKIAQNIKYDMLVLKWYGIAVCEPMYDTMLAHYLIKPDMKHGMDVLSETYLGYKPISIETLIGKKGKAQKSMREVDPNEITIYAAEDADITLQLEKCFTPMLKKEKVEKLFHDVEMPLVPVLTDMEYEGINLDAGFLEKFSKDLTKDLVKIRDKIFKQAGTEFNLDSPRQLGEVLFDKMEIPYEWKKTKTGQYSTNEQVLKSLEARFDIAKEMLNYRELNKLRSTYVDALPALVNPKTKRIHTSYHQAVAATGRLASQNPNLQNIPIRSEIGRRTRKAFVPRNKDHVLLAADYSQVELRIIAALSEETNMIEAFKEGQDIHASTAAKVFDVPLSKVTRDQRSRAKAVNFGLIYGQGAFGLSQGLGIKRGEAKEIIDNYFSKYPKLKDYMEESKEFARKNGYVQTILGRKRYLPDIKSANFTVRGFAERNAINAPIQGSAADVIKVAMINLHKEMKRKKMKSKMLLQVHDELVFDAHKKELNDLKGLIEDKMANAIPLNVPLLVEIGTGENWLEAH